MWKYRVWYIRLPRREGAHWAGGRAHPAVGCHHLPRGTSSSTYLMPAGRVCRGRWIKRSMPRSATPCCSAPLCWRTPLTCSSRITDTSRPSSPSTACFKLVRLPRAHGRRLYGGHLNARRRFLTPSLFAGDQVHSFISVARKATQQPWQCPLP